MRIIAHRVLALGVLFLLSPVWAFPFINEFAISIVNGKYKNPASSWIAFTSYDVALQMLQYRTITTLYFIGVVVTCIAGLLFIFSQPKKDKISK
jgi:hypothetical protein